MAAILACPGTLHAQNLDAETPEALSTPKSQSPIELGGFSLSPSIDISLRYDSNIYNTETDETSDGLAIIRPKLEFGPNLARHELTASFESELRRYFDTSAEDSEQFVAQLAGRLDLPSRTTVSARAGYANLIEQRGTYGDIFSTDDPIEYARRFANVSASRTGGIIEARVSFDISDIEYRGALFDGNPIDLSSRDASTKRVMAQFTAPVAARLRGLIQGKYNRIDYEDDPSRNSSGKSIMAGLRYKVTDQIDAEAAVGYAVQSTQIDGADYSGIDYSARILWSPDARATISADWGLTFRRSPIAQSPVLKQQLIILGARYALSNVLLGEVEASYRKQDLLSAERSDNRFAANAKLFRTFGPRLRAFLSTGYRRQTSAGSVSGREYNGWNVSVGTRIRF